MTSLPCYEILGLNSSADNTVEAIDNAYNRLKGVLENDDIETAYDTLRVAQTRAAYTLNMVAFKNIDWSWKDHEDENGVWRSLVRSKVERTNEWSDKGQRDIKKNKMNDRKGNRDKRRGGGYDD